MGEKLTQGSIDPEHNRAVHDRDEKGHNCGPGKKSAITWNGNVSGWKIQRKMIAQMNNGSPKWSA